jgi:hypothetical protein
MILDSNILIGVLAILILVLVIDVFCLRRKIRKFLRGEKNENLGAVIQSFDKEIHDLEGFRGEMQKYLVNLEKRVRRSTQIIETVRFNAFSRDAVGGYQSFATAILNEDGDGTVISSLYSRERVSVFAKPIAKFISEIELSDEEKQVVEKAKGKLTLRT